jgi:hypothetical protein
MKRVLLILLLTILGCGGSKPSVVMEPTARSASALSTGGTVTTPTPATCPGGYPSGATCSTATVTCAGGLDAMNVLLVVNQPKGTPKGTIVFLTGGGGNKLDDHATQLAIRYPGQGFTLVQPVWQGGNWEVAPEGTMIGAACRPAVLLDWAHSYYNTGTAFCAEGWSGGSAAISYSMTFYGLSSELNYVSLLSGPPFGRIDYGCGASYGGGTKQVCGVQFPLPYNGAVGYWLANHAENTASCGTLPPLPPADILRWGNDSVVTQDTTKTPVFNYPTTPIEFAWCPDPNQNAASALGSFYYDAITSTKSIVCGSSGPTCTGENILGDSTAYLTITTDMVNGCHL